MGVESLKLFPNRVFFSLTWQLSFFIALAAGPSYAAEPVAKAPPAKAAKSSGKAPKDLKKNPTDAAKSAEKPVVDMAAGLSLAKASACLTCHGVDKKIIGPGFKEIALRYKGDSGAAARLTEKVKAGGGGVWGAVPMPPNPQVKAEDIKTLVYWVLAQ